MSVAGVEQLDDVVSEEMSFADRAYLVIRDKLIMLDIRPNEAIVENDLAAELELGRTPVREALKRLEADRLVVSFPRRGTFATGVDVADPASGHLTDPRGRARGERHDGRSGRPDPDLRQRAICHL